MRSCPVALACPNQAPFEPPDQFSSSRREGSDAGKAAAHKNHQGGGHEHHDGFQKVGMCAIKIDLENERSENACEHGHERADVKGVERHERPAAPQGCSQGRDDQNRL